MAFVTGLLLIDAPASALNNLGNIPGERVENTSGVKIIRMRDGTTYPYVSAQAFRYWLRTTAEARVEGWKAAPMYREEKIAYTDSNPMTWWDDDLLGYMRAPSKKTTREQQSKDASRTETGIAEPVTRVSPFRVSTLVSIAPVNITSDFGVMSRHEGDPVPFEHQLYRTTLKGLFSLDLHACGTFSYRNKAGYRNLDAIRTELAKQQRLEHIEVEKAYRLPFEERIRRVQGLFEGLALLEGGAKQAIHYTDVTPAFCILAVTRGGNHIFGHTVGANKGLPEIKLESLREALTIMGDEILSPIYVGWVRGYLDEQREQFERFIEAFSDRPILIRHPRDAYREFVIDLARSENAYWLA
ncbi:MAG: type I-B CRISPR-associated protein Cas7/Cst2/DevR [Ktedonobacteraceae bacterium]